MRRVFLIAAPLIIAGIVAYVAVRISSNNDNDNTSDVAVIVINANGTNATNGTPNVNAKPLSRDQVLSLARLFSERYGTTLTDSPNANIDSVISFASASLKETFQRQKTRPAVTPGQSISITSTALAFKIVSMSDKIGTAEVIVTLQRKEDRGSGSPTVFTQDLLLSFVFESGAWKVNTALWMARAK